MDINEMIKKLQNERKREIKQLWKKGMSAIDIAKKVGVTRQRVYQILQLGMK